MKIDSNSKARMRVTRTMGTGTIGIVVGAYPQAKMFLVMWPKCRDFPGETKSKAQFDVQRRMPDAIDWILDTDPEEETYRWELRSNLQVAPDSDRSLLDAMKREQSKLSAEPGDDDVPISISPSKQRTLDFKKLSDWEVAIDGFKSLTLKGQIVAIWDNQAVVRIMEGSSKEIMSGAGVIEYKAARNPFGAKLLADSSWHQLLPFIENARYLMWPISGLAWAKPEDKTLTREELEKLPMRRTKALLDTKSLVGRIAESSAMNEDIKAARDRIAAGLGVPKELIGKSDAVRKADDLMTKQGVYGSFLHRALLKTEPFKYDHHCRFCGANQDHFEGHKETCEYRVELRRLEQEHNKKLEAQWPKQKAAVPQTREEFMATFERRMPPKRTVTFHTEPMFDVEEE